MKQCAAWVIALQERYKNKRYAREKLFISNVAHELRTPLAIIKTETEVALLYDKVPLELRKSFKSIVVELDRISEIINNLLSLNTLSRPEQMHFGHIDLYPLVHSIVRRHLPLAKERGIALMVRKEGFRAVWGNSIALEQVVNNLIKNALAYTPKHAGGKVTVTINPAPENTVKLSVTDTGIGIAQDDLNHIFEPFYRADTSRTRRIQKSGSGLGLTIVNEIVRAHHGKIEIESIERQGTSVSVYLPGSMSRDEGLTLHESFSNNLVR
ncbi:HAMP domain-containing histidine kinase [Candidatus Parcubacteria bacterium]|nr:HAMP domain-containing histidine kinase [Candidatus Parcubacteria bacterium]